MQFDCVFTNACSIQGMPSLKHTAIPVIYQIKLESSEKKPKHSLNSCKTMLHMTGEIKSQSSLNISGCRQIDSFLVSKARVLIKTNGLALFKGPFFLISFERIKSFMIQTATRGLKIESYLKRIHSPKQLKQKYYVF